MSQDIRIAIAQRGWVFVGAYHEENGSAVLTGAKCIRRWGTTGGLGQLAEHGPLPRTVLDDALTVRVPLQNVVATIACVSGKWDL